MPDHFAREGLAQGAGPRPDSPEAGPLSHKLPQFASDYGSGTYSALKDHGLLVDPEDEDLDTVYRFPDDYTFIRRCDETMEAAKDDPRVQVDQNSWDALEDFRAGAAGRWLYDQ